MTLQIDIAHRQGGFDLQVAFAAPPGLTVLFGPSGAGKTTVVNALAGLLRPDRGRIAVGGRVLVDTAAGVFLPPHRRRIGYVFQEGRLFPHLTVRQNLAYGRWFAPRGAAREDMDRVIEMLGIGPLLARRPGALSGGERARVAIGRALLSAPGLILADEPLAALDEPRRAEILPYFERLRDQAGVPILYVSHSTAEVARLATTVVALRHGRVALVGPAAQVLGDAAAMGAREVASILPARVVAHHDDGLSELEAPGGRLWLPGVAAPVGAALRLRIPAQEVILSPAPPGCSTPTGPAAGRIAQIRPGQGPGVLVTLDLGGARLVARLTRRSAEALHLAPGQPCHAIVKSVALAPQDILAAPAAAPPDPAA